MTTAQEKRLQDYKDTFGPEHGQRVLRDLMAQFFIFHTAFSAKTGAMELSFCEGERNVILFILNQLQEPIDPKRFLSQADQAGTDYQQ